jgi:hypothetical protein
MTEHVGYLKKDRREKFVCGGGRRTRAWFVNAWRIVDANGKDLIQPWQDTKGEARRVAKASGIKLIEKE